MGSENRGGFNQTGRCEGSQQHCEIAVQEQICVKTENNDHIRDKEIGSQK